MQDVIDAIDFTDDGKLKTSDMGRMFITVNAGKSGPFNPAKALVRCQFMEMMIRCAIEKYLVADAVKTELEAIKMFNEKCISKCPKMT